MKKPLLVMMRRGFAGIAQKGRSPGSTVLIFPAFVPAGAAAGRI
jgi:hypothetical protein